MITQYFDTSIKKWRQLFVGLGLLLLLLFALNISLGSVAIPLSSVIDFILLRPPEDNSWHLIMAKFRLPKALTATLVGGGLGICGLQMQTLFRNPMAGPFILGISSGSGLGVALVIFLGVEVGLLFELSGIARSWIMVCAAALGSFGVLLAIILASVRLKDSVTLLILGLMLGAASSALISILQYFSQATNIQAYMIWSFGSLGSLSWNELMIFSVIIIIGMIMSIGLSKSLNALLLGANYAESMGVDLKIIRVMIILNTSLLAGTITAFCGPIAFFGLAIPHIARMLFNTTNHLLLTPLIILIGGILMLLFDTVSQLPSMEATLPINAVTALLGAPFVIYLLLKKRNIHYTFDK